MSEQHMNALALANRVRLARAATKRRIKAGEVAVVDVLRDPPWETETMGVGELLRAQDRWGTKRASKLLSGLAVGERRQLKTLTIRQRESIAAALSGHRMNRPEAQVSVRIKPQLNGTWKLAKEIGECIGVTATGAGIALQYLERNGQAERLVSGNLTWWRAAA